MDFTKLEIAGLVGNGYQPGFIGDIQERDMVAIAPISREDPWGRPRTVRYICVNRIDINRQSEVVSFIGYEGDALPDHFAYGWMYPCYIKKEPAVGEEDPLMLLAMSAVRQSTSEVQAVKKLRGMANIDLRQAIILIRPLWSEE